jgi:hypothetical protein
MEETGFIYGLIDPRDRLFHYIGQTRKEPLKRMMQHWYSPKGKATIAWIEDLRCHDIRPFLYVLERPVLSMLRRRETYWIAALLTHRTPLANTFYPMDRDFLAKAEPWDLPNDILIYTPGDILEYSPDAPDQA